MNRRSASGKHAVDRRGPHVELIPVIAVISGEQLVAAFAGQHDLHLRRGQLETKCSETLDGQVIGSSSCQISEGSALKNSSIPMTTS